MKDRCLNPKARYFPSYGGRGITVCERWLRFPEFLADVGEPPDPSLALGRIKNDKGYEPGNVRWETRSQQNQNTRRNRIYAVNGITGCMVVLARHFGLQPHVVKNRLVKGWSVDAAFTTPFVKGKRALRPNQTQQPPAKSP